MVAFASADGTATAASGDYIAASGTVTFNPGETNKTVTVLVNGDASFESDETFFVNLLNSTNAIIADAQGTGTITNDDAANTPTGTDVVAQPADATTGTTPITLTFSNVTEGGTTSLTTSSAGPPSPSGFKLGTPPTYYDITTTAGFSGAVTVCINYGGINYGNESNLKLNHYENGMWVDRTFSLDTNNDLICASVTSLSPFVIFEPDNQPPIANAGTDQTIACSATAGTQITLDGSGSSDPEGDPLLYTWRENASDLAAPTNSPTLQVSFGLGSHTITLTVDDSHGNVATDQVIITVEDTQPAVIVQITAPVDPIQVSIGINTNATFTDACVIGTHTTIWEWGDGSTTAGTVEETNGAGTVTGDHTYATAGVYTLKLTVTDNADKSGEAFFRYVVIYDPSAGYVTGGGWIDSPLGAYVDNPSLTGKANFGFVSKYAIGKTTPEGNTQFSFKVADLKFHSTSYDWLVIAGAHAKYKGSGMINGSGDYGFMLTATDGQVNGGGGVDKFRIKIWRKDATETVVYDNQMGASDDADAADAIEGGSIVMHSSSAAKSGELSADEATPGALPESYALFQNYPNPFNPQTEIRFALPEANHVVVKIFNLLGVEMRTLVDEQREAGYHRVHWDGRDENGKAVTSGIYLYQLRVGSFSQVKKMSLLQ
jgi:hypothetical protein